MLSLCLWNSSGGKCCCNTVSNGDAQTSKTDGADSKNLVCLVINGTDFEVVAPFAWVSCSIVVRRSRSVVLLIVIVALDLQRSRGSDSNTSIGVDQVGSVCSYDAQNSTVVEEFGCCHPVFVLSVIALRSAEDIDQLLLSCDSSRFINRTQFEGTSNRSDIIENVFGLFLL